jgi:hypothetical protein
MRRRKDDRVWLVTNTATHAGGSMIARTPLEAAERARMAGWMRKAREVEVRSFVGLPLIREVIAFAG